ncbi:MAG: glycine oxidase ThiO [Nitrosomonadales bacterium]|nr:glycine oxidase ThiO [Nitrosomonadales bacterium]
MELENMDFVVIGAGVNGLAAAERLLQQGASVTVLEQGQVGRESSWAGGGILSPLCPWDYPDEVTRLANRGMALFGDYAAALYVATGIDPEYQRSGMLVLPPVEAESARSWCTARGMALQTVLAADTLPGVSGDALLLPEVAQARNPRLMQALKKQVELLGGRIVEHCAVQGIEASDDRVTALATAAGSFSAERYIVTTGAWSRQVLGKYALHLDIKPVRGQMLLFKFDAPPLPHIVLQDGLYLIPRRDGHLLVGSTLEDVGFDKSTTASARDELLRRALALLPALREMPIVQHWAGLRPASPHNLPTICRHPALENLYLNSGHFRYGVTMSPASTEILLNELNGTPQPFDVTPYRVGWNGLSLNAARAEPA